MCCEAGSIYNYLVHSSHDGLEQNGGYCQDLSRWYFATLILKRQWMERWIYSGIDSSPYDGRAATCRLGLETICKEAVR